MDKPRILTIDDDYNLRKTLSDILRAKGYETLTAKDGTEGLELLKQCSVEVVLIDLGLPDIPGIELLNTIKTSCPSTEAIILTGHATLDSAIEATNRGAFSYLQKPFDIDQLILQIRRAIDKQQTEKERKRLEDEREKLITQLQNALSKVKTLSGMLPICSFCKRVRNDGGYWHQIETYISEHSEAEFSHGLCPECEKKQYEELERLKKHRDKDSSNKQGKGT